MRRSIGYFLNFEIHGAIQMIRYKLIAIAIVTCVISLVYAQTKKSVPKLVEMLADEYRVATHVDKHGSIYAADYNPMESTDDETQKVIDRLSKIESLQMVWLHNVDLNKELLQRLGTLPKLGSLKLVGCRFKDKDLEALAEFSSLVELDLSHTSITDAGLAYLEPMKKLKILTLDDTEITGGGFKHLRSLPQLQYLHLRLTPITNDSMEAIGQIYSLHVLDMHNTAISEDGIKHLTGLYQLTKLVTEAKVDDEFRNAQAAARKAANEKGLVPKHYPKLVVIDN
jgi:hypothetical protein